MSVFELDPASALVVVDLQKAIAAFPAVHPVPDVVANAARIAAAFRAHGLPVALVTVAGRAPGRTEQARAAATAGVTPPAPAADGMEVFAELAPHPDDIAVVKRTWGAFTGTDLDAQLRARGVTQVVVAGIATSMGVESTARQAHELGYHVTLATDAMTDRSLETHDHRVRTLFPALGETGTTDEVLALLAATR
jgi:nicotinamidase-related amidase